MYKALRVLEKNKDKETPFFSKPIEKLIRHLQKKIPSEYGIPMSLVEFAN